MSVSDLPTPQPAVPMHEKLRIVLIVIALIKGMNALTNITILFGDFSDVPGPGVGGALVKLAIAVNPLLAIAAFVLALRGRIQHAIVALAAMMAMTWLNDMPSVVLHGFDTSGSVSITLLMALQIVGYPLMAACASALALRDRSLIAATVMVCLPTVIAAGSLMVFAIGISIYGF